jgi:hypothetical protein
MLQSETRSLSWGSNSGSSEEVVGEKKLLIRDDNNDNNNSNNNKVGLYSFCVTCTNFVK